MSAIFMDELHEQLGTWPLGYIPYGGADYGEVEAIAHAIGDGDDTLFYDAWFAADFAQSLSIVDPLPGRKGSSMNCAAPRPLFGSAAIKEPAGIAKCAIVPSSIGVYWIGWTRF